jgi:hypothetical protein
MTCHFLYFSTEHDFFFSGQRVTTQPVATSANKCMSREGTFLFAVGTDAHFFSSSAYAVVLLDDNTTELVQLRDGGRVQSSLRRVVGTLSSESFNAGAAHVVSLLLSKGKIGWSPIEPLVTPKKRELRGRLSQDQKKKPAASAAKKKAAPAAPPPDSPKATISSWGDLECDQCSMSPIEGSLWTCTRCDDFDLVCVRAFFASLLCSDITSFVSSASRVPARLPSV